VNYTYPKDLLSRIRDEWTGAEHLTAQPPELPSDDFLNEFLELSYQASMLAEEHRRIGFRLAYISPETANQLAGPVELGRLHEPVIFRSPRKFTVGEILRIAPATDHTKVLVCVSPMKGDEPDSAESLKIWGILDTGSSWWNYTQGESQVGNPPPDCLTLSSIEPGNLTISRGGMVLFSLLRGEIITPRRRTLYMGPLAKFFQNGEVSIYGDVLDQLGGVDGDNVDLLKDTPKHYYFRFLESLLFQIREGRHGGAVIVMPDTGEKIFDTLKDLVMVKYPCDYDYVQSMIVRAIALKHKYKNLYRESYKSAGNISIANHRQLDSMTEQRREIENRITDTIKLLASASSVDGAVLMTDRFRLLGFGAEIIVSAPNLHNVHLANDSEAKSTTLVPIESYGTRHRSAFRFCWENPESVAFVVSMDGGVKCARRIDDKLVFWPDINFGPLGI